MTRTIVAIEPLGADQVIFKLAGTPFTIQNAGINQLFNPSEILPSTGVGTVRQLGEALYAKLRDNTAVVDAINRALATGDGPSYPIGFQITDEETAALAWEGLAVETKFPALEARFPIVRVVTPVSAVQRQAFAPPLRMLAFLSALHRPGRKEWLGLKAAVDAARSAGFAVRLKVMVSEEELRAEIEATPDPDLEVNVIPQLSTDLNRIIGEFRPQILHFFCHGSITDGIRRLELATVTDWDQPEGPEAQSSLKVMINELAEMNKGTWLMVLNACEGGAGSHEAYSFASDLVKAGLPAAVAMRRTIDVLDANTFTAAFYPSLFALLRAVTGSGAAEATVEWADLLLGARRALRDRHGDPNDDDTWTLPVLYVQPAAFQFVTNTKTAVADVERSLGSADVYQALAELLKSADAPSEVLAELQNHAAAKVQAAGS